MQYLKLSGEFRCISEYATGEEALAGLPRDNPAVALMDIKMEGMKWDRVRSFAEGENAHSAGHHAHGVRGYGPDFRALCAGATGYLLKRQPPEKLLEAIRDVVEGGSPMLSASIARKVVQLVRRSNRPERSEEGEAIVLSERQRQVLQTSSAAGKPYKAIAEDMAVSIHTVRSYLRRTYEKLHVHSRTEAVAKYRKR